MPDIRLDVMDALGRRVVLERTPFTDRLSGYVALAVKPRQKQPGQPTPALQWM